MRLKNCRGLNFQLRAHAYQFLSVKELIQETVNVLLLVFSEIYFFTCFELFFSEFRINEKKS